LACWQSHRSIAFDFFFEFFVERFLLPRTAKVLSRPAGSRMCADIRALAFDEECRRGNDLSEWNRLSTGIFTCELREQRTRPPGRIVVAKAQRTTMTGWFISHCVIQWNTIEHGKKTIGG
jgi:hypothetical protein